MGVPGSIVVTQCHPIVLLSADAGSWPRGPLCFMGPSWYFMALLPVSLGRGRDSSPKKDYKDLTAPLPFSQLRSVLMRFGQILQDLFEVLTKKRPKTDNVFQKQIGEYFEIF